MTDAITTGTSANTTAASSTTNATERLTFGIDLGDRCPGYDRLKPRRWRHLDFGAWQGHLEATLARVECSRCGAVVEQVSWAEP